ncbi:uncharacterized protein LOC110603133 [Manihot esculenta]|uniref:Uncharacterized protein n=1 Tax=Manihot esculenta TaxID=3983 RepID=A0A2C9UBJ0_MANES|nr:uncharacterized protein LOC110603133 [Manihot esculenta]OAY27592.1 hypothetical protein MANES_16G137500v8 [Manihot esculenta]
MATVMVLSPPKLNYSRMSASPWRRMMNTTSATRHFFKPLHCVPVEQLQLQDEQVDSIIMCEPCNGKGWLLCDFCKGLKTNVKAENKRIYRRCPSCRAIGYVICPKCKVFKCVTFPNYNDGEDAYL